MSRKHPHRIPEPAIGPIRPRPEYAELLDKATEEGYRRGLKRDPFNPYPKKSSEWHRFEAGYYLGYKHLKEKERGESDSATRTIYDRNNLLPDEG